MAIKVGGVEVVDNNRQLKNINSVDSGSVNVLNSALNTDPTRATLTKTFTNGETASITLNQAVSTAPVVSVIKEVPQTGFSSKGAWDVNATASNYDLYDYAPNTTLTPTSSASVDAINTSTIQGAHLSVSGIFSNGRGVRLSPDGTKAYVINEHRNSGQNTIRQWTLSTPFDTNTATHSGYFAETVGEQYARGFDFNGNGTKLYIIGYNNHVIQEYSLSTAYDVTTATATVVTYSTSNISTASYLTFGNNGYKMYICDTGGNAYIHQYTLSTAYDLSSITNVQTISNPNGAGGGSRGIQFSDDGLTMFNLSQNSNWFIYQNTLSTAWDITSTVTQTHTLGVSANANNPMGLYIKDEHVYTFDLGGPHALYYKRTSSSVSNLTLGTGSFTAANVGMRIQGNGGDVRLADTAGNYTIPTGGSDFTDQTAIAAGSWTMHGLAPVANGLTLPSSQVTGQGWSSNFRVGAYTDYYNVSGQTTTPVGLHMASDGSHFYVCEQSSGQIKVYSMGTNYTPSTATYRGDYIVSNVTGNQYDVAFNNTGTKMFVQDYFSSNEAVREYSLTTAWRPDTGTVTLLNTYTMTGNETNTPSTGGAIQFSNNGLRFYYLPYAVKTGNQSETSTNKTGTSFQSPIKDQTGVIYQWTLGTAYDLSTATYGGYKRVPIESFASFGITEDGKWLVNGGYNSSNVVYYPIPDAWDVTSIDASAEVYINYNNYNIGGTTDAQIASSWSQDHYYVISYNDDIVHKLPWGPTQAQVQLDVVTDGYQVAVTNASGQIDSSSWTDINSMTADQSLGNGEAYYAVSTDDRTTWSVAKGSDGVRPIVRDNAGTWQYNSNTTYGSTTWTNATTNDEFYALQQALGATSVNRMDKTQLDAVADGSHFTLGNTLDLMIALKQTTDVLPAPTSDGVTINYDAEALQQGAILGTDYDYQFPNSTTVELTSNAAQNLKIRVV